MEEKKKLKLTFASGVTTVTGANFVLEKEATENEKGVIIVIDCGLVQGGAEASKENKKEFIYDPEKVDYLFITHAHIDHIGRIPKLVKDGFKGKIFSTPETRALVPMMLEDCLKLINQEAEHKGFPPLYNQENIDQALGLWHEIPYHSPLKISGGFEVYAKDAGHILGSAMYEISYNKGKIVFTGDLGNSPTPLLRETEKITDATYIVMESVYGDRNHETHQERRDKLEDVIEDSVKRGGALVIPCFSLEKTQVLLFEINELLEQKRIPDVPVYLDSPLAIKVTNVYKTMTSNMNETARDEIKKGEDIFAFPHLKFVQNSDDSKRIIEAPNPKIIIAGSGMSTGGRIIHHEAAYLPDPKSTILLLGYQSFGTLGRDIQNHQGVVSIHGNKVPVKAHIESIDGYSSHKDSEHLIEFVSYARETLKMVFPVMGEPASSMFLAQRIEDYLGVPAYHPEDGESIILDF